MKVFKMLKKYSSYLIAILFLGVFFFLLLQVNYTREIAKNIYYFAFKETLKQSFSNCVPDNLKSNNFKTLLVAGHTYGIGNHTNNATYPKFLYALEHELLKVKNNKKIDKIILAGDIVKEARIKNFLEVKEKIEKFTDEIIVAPGNHDFGPNILGDKSHENDFLKVFNKNYAEIDFNNSIFFILDTASNFGNIPTEQINLITNKLKIKNKFKNIFIITHHVVWSEMMNKRGIKISPNLPQIKNNNFNKFYSVIKKFSNKANVYLISGDIAVAPGHSKLFCEKDNNFFFIATGMGNGRLDNYLKIKISKDGEEIKIEPIFF